MPFELWLAYAIAATVIVIIPGPTILLVITQSLSHGKSATIPLALGVMLGDSVALLFSLLGLGAILATSAILFSAVKWVGAAYLVYLGISLWLTSDKVIEATKTAQGKNPDHSLYTHLWSQHLTQKASYFLSHSCRSL